MMPFIKNAGAFLHKHRNKILVASVVAVAAAVYIQYSAVDEPAFVSNNDDSPEDATDGEESLDDKVENPSNNTTRFQTSDKSRQLVRMRRQFDTAFRQFIPTLRIKIIEVVDINGTVRQIKELRAKASQESSRQLEAQLWEEIKISSFTMLFVTAYMISAVCVLLKLQLHILARSTHTSEQQRSHSNFNSSVGDDSGNAQLDESMLRELVECTYKHMFGSGLKTFSERIKQRISADLDLWTVQEKLSVQFGDLLEVMGAVRRNAERDLPYLIQTIFIPQEGDESSGDSPIKGGNSGNSPYSGGYASSSSSSSARGIAVQSLLNETWDLIESPAFATVYSESIDACFRLIADSLRNTVFLPENPSSSDALRTVPLASLLPQVKAVANRLLPSSVDAPVSSDIRDISSGPCLDSFCLAVFDAPGYA